MELHWKVTCPESEENALRGSIIVTRNDLVGVGVLVVGVLVRSTIVTGVGVLVDVGGTGARVDVGSGGVDVFVDRLDGVMEGVRVGVGENETDVAVAISVDWVDAVATVTALVTEGVGVCVLVAAKAWELPIFAVTVIVGIAGSPGG